MLRFVCSQQCCTPPSQSGDRPSCQRGDIIKALHPGLECFVRARVVDVRKYKLPDAPSRWIVRVRWCDSWTDEPESTVIIEPSIASKATLPQNRHLSFVQIVSNPFQHFPLYSEVFYQHDQSEDVQDENEPLSINSWSPGFVTEESEYQYRIDYLNPQYRPHPIEVREEAQRKAAYAKHAESLDKEKRELKKVLQKEKIKTTYKQDLIRMKLKKDRKEKIRENAALRIKIREWREQKVEQARAEKEALEKQLEKLKAAAADAQKDSPIADSAATANSADAPPIAPPTASSSVPLPPSASTSTSTSTTIFSHPVTIAELTRRLTTAQKRLHDAVHAREEDADSEENVPYEKLESWRGEIRKKYAEEEAAAAAAEAEVAQRDREEENSRASSASTTGTQMSLTSLRDTSDIYHIDYDAIDTEHIYDPENQRDGNGGERNRLEKLEEDQEYEEEEEFEKNMQGDEFNDADPASIAASASKPLDQVHPSTWLDENGDEKVAEPLPGLGRGKSLRRAKSRFGRMESNKPGLARIESGKPGMLTRLESVLKPGVNRMESNKPGMGRQESMKPNMNRQESAKFVGGSSNDFGEEGGDGFYDDSQMLTESSDEEDDPNAPAGARPPPLEIEGSTDIDLPVRTSEEQRLVTEYQQSFPKWLYVWVNKYSRRIKKQSSFFNTLYEKKLRGKEDESSAEQLKKQLLINRTLLSEQEKHRKKWYHIFTKSDASNQVNDAVIKLTDTIKKKIIDRINAEFARRAEEKQHAASLASITDDTIFDSDDTGLEKLRYEIYSRIYTQNQSWYITELIELDGSHLTEDYLTQQEVQYERKIPMIDLIEDLRDQKEMEVWKTRKSGKNDPPKKRDRLWDSFVYDSWVRYRYEYAVTLPTLKAFEVKSTVAPRASTGATPADRSRGTSVAATGGASLTRENSRQQPDMNRALSRMPTSGFGRTPTLNSVAEAKASDVPLNNNNQPPPPQPTSQQSTQFRWIWAKVIGKDDHEMILELYPPKELAGTGILPKRDDKDKVTPLQILCGLGKDTNANEKSDSYALDGGVSAFSSGEKVLLKKDNRIQNARLIKYYYDRMRRWSQDSSRRYQIELARNGMFLCFISRACSEAVEDWEETEKLCNYLIDQYEVEEVRKEEQERKEQEEREEKEKEKDKKNAAYYKAKKDDSSSSSASESKSSSSTAKPSSSRSLTSSEKKSSTSPQPLNRDSHSPDPSTSHLPTSVFSTSDFTSNYLTSSESYGLPGYDDIREDGNSLYRAISLQLFGTPENYLYIKRQCLLHIAQHPSYYCAFLDINFEYYLSLKFRSLDPKEDVISYGDHLDLQAICEIYDVAVHVYSQVELGAKEMAEGNWVKRGGMGTAATYNSTAAAAPTQHAPITSPQTINPDSLFPEPSSSTITNPSSLLQNQPFLRFYDNVHPDGIKLPTICLSYSGAGHYDAIKHRAIQWPLQSLIGYPVYTRTRIMNIVLRARQKTEFETIERVRVEEAMRAYQLISSATANAPMGKTAAMKTAAKRRKAQRLKRQADKAAGKKVPDSESEEEDVTLETVISQMVTKTTRQVKPIDTQKMELQRTILQPRELVLSTYIGEVLFRGDKDIQTAIFLDCLASCKLDYGTKRELLSTGYNVQQLTSQYFWHDMQLPSMADLVSRKNLEGLAAQAMYGQEDGASGATTETGEGLKLNLPRVVVMYPYFPEDAHLEGEELERHRERRKGQVNQTGLPPLMLIEGVQLAVEEMVRLVRRMAKISKLVKTSQATWLPPA